MKKSKLITSLIAIGSITTVAPTTFIACAANDSEIEGARKVTLSLNLGKQLLGTYSLTVAKQNQNNVHWSAEGLPSNITLSREGSMPSFITASVLTLSMIEGEQPNSFSFTLKAEYQDKTYKAQITVNRLN